VLVYKNYDQARLDAQYNNRARVEDFDALVREWGRRSAAFRTRAWGLLDVFCGQDEREMLDIFPSGRKNAPVHVFLHGGYWQAMDKGLFHFVGEGLYDRGAVVAFVNYPLAPRVGMDDIVASCRRSVAWLRERAPSYGGDPGRIFVSGHSAGGHLAAMLLTEEGSEGGAPPAFAGVCAVSGLFDLNPVRLSYLNEVLGLDEETALRNSPVSREPAAACPCIAAVGGLESEEYHAQSREFVKAWSRKGVETELSTLEGADHFSALDVLADPASPLFQRIAGWMGL